MTNLTKNQELDFQKWFNEDGDPGFSPERNKAIVEKTIRKHELNILRKKKDYAEAIRERADAVASYLKSLANGKEWSVERYFGRKELVRLRGQQIIQKLQGNKTLLDDKGNERLEIIKN